MEDSDEDIEGQDLSHPPRTAVLWEKSFEQSIFVDLSEDESLHFSDLESSFPVRLTQSAGSEASLQLSGNAELSALEDSSSSEGNGSSSKDAENVLKSRGNNSIKQGSLSRPRNIQAEPPSPRDDEDLAQNTSDEDQEDLPFDGDLGSPYFNHTSSTESTMSSEGRETPHASSELTGPVDGRENHAAQNHSLIEMTTKEPDLRSQELSGNPAKAHSSATPANLAAPTCSSPVPVAQQPDITQLLLRHFSREELCCSGKLIEAETLPEVSLLDSMDDTLLSTALKNNPAGIPRKHNLSRGSPTVDNYTNQGAPEGSCDKTADDGSDSDSLKHDNSVTEDLSSAPRSNASNSNSSEHQSEDLRLMRRETAVESDNVPLVRARSCGELKYGQGQVHYPLPDFSKVAPKVKIPKGPSGTNTTTTTTNTSTRPPAQPPSTMHRAQSTPGVLGLVSRVLEDSDQAPKRPFVFPDQEKHTTSPGMVHHLQAEYDKLLTKYAEAENMIDEMRLGNRPQTPNEDLLRFDSVNYQGHQGSHFESSVPPLSPPAVQFSEELVHRSTIELLNQESFNQPSEQDPTDGERMTNELRDIISEFMKKVEEFKVSLNITPAFISLEDQQMMFRSMVEAQDQLERKYISNKEEHRALEMQNYIGLRRNTGVFDPDRLVEGDIFRIGMRLEDIKETIDRNVCSQLSPPHSSSTPTSMPPMPSLAVNPSHPHLSDTSLPSSQHKPGAWFPLSANEMWGAAAEEEEEQEEEEEEASEDQGDSELNQSRESSATLSSEDSSPPQRSHTHPHRLQESLEGPDITATAAAAAAAVDDDEEQRVERSCSFSERKVSDNVSACVTETTSSSRQTQWTPESLFTQDSTLSAGSERELADSNGLAANDSQAANERLDASYSLVAIDSLDASDSLASSDSPAVECFSSSNASETQSLCLSQRIVSPETDSGFGSSDLLQPGVGIYQSELLAQSDAVVVHPHSDGLSASDSEDSSSNLQTAVPSPAPAEQPRWRSSRPAAGQSDARKHTDAPGCGAATAVERWVESTAKERPIRRQEHLRQFRSNQVKHHLSEPSLSTAMQAPLGLDRLHSCSCNSEALVALQREMSQLKKDLEDGLVQLPHLAQKMDYLTSKFNLDRQSKTRQTRITHHRGLKSLGSRSEVWEDGSQPGSSRLRLEDWISTDMEQSKSKDSGQADDSKVMLQFNNAPVGDSRGSSSSLYLCSELPRAPQGKRHAYRGKEVRRVHSKEKLSPLSPPPLHKPLLQVNYTSSCSLPASYKVGEAMQSSSNQRKRSVQSDSALLPSNVFFQRTPSPALEYLRTDRTARRRGSKEEEMNRTLDRAIEAARSMKRTTDRMAKSLSADLAKAQLHRRPQHARPLGGRRGNAL
ncbi:uncharacterized protein aknad1 isoform X2 [Gadus morhua]|uniref:Uncharacterized LOC115548709 n=1 Tax=Gadus morhua TaxID=8049 RepID=A0A8C5CM13_GADMO|nr:uncharacterized protein LOC115548709 isoform X2 [Gadus morhua]